jgi:hypothetical protein
MSRRAGLRLRRSRPRLELLLVVLIAPSGSVLPFYDLLYGGLGGQALSLIYLFAFGVACCAFGVYVAVRSHRGRGKTPVVRSLDTPEYLLVSSRGLIWVALGLPWVYSSWQFNVRPSWWRS